MVHEFARITVVDIMDSMNKNLNVYVVPILKLASRYSEVSTLIANLDVRQQEGNLNLSYKFLFKIQ